MSRDCNREGLLERASRGGGGAAKTRWANLLLAVDRGGFADLRTAGAEAARASRPTAGTAHDPTRRPVGEGSTACSRARRTAGRETPGQAARSRRCGGCRTTCSPRRGIVLVWGDPSTRPVGSPCEAFPSREAERLASRLEVRHTPRHVSRQLTEQGHPARAISPKPARARICRQRRSRSPQRPSFSR